MSSANSQVSSRPPAEKAKKHARSRGGCTRCRTRRQKCDEQRPMCSRCKEHNIEECVYTVSLQWGGRNFQNYAKNADIKKYETEPGTFVYVTSAKQGVTSSRTSKSPSLSAVCSPRSLSPLDSATPLEQQLLHHFAHSATRVTSCHSAIQSEFNSLLLRTAISYPPLLSALMAHSAIHRNSLYSNYHQLGSSDLTDNTIISLKNSSITQLRCQLMLPMPLHIREAVLATALTLCMCEIHSGADQPRSWRLHLEGAREILSSENLAIPPDPNSPRGLLERWYTSIEALAAITSKGLNAGQMSPLPSPSSSLNNAIYLDDYFGFSTDLVGAFKEIGAAAWERRSLSSLNDQSLLSEQDLRNEAESLEQNIQAMILRDSSSPSVFYPQVHHQLSPDVIQEFRLCNEAYQHTALLHIYRSVRLLPVTDPKVQHSVKKILECVSGIQPRGGLSPYIVLTMPLFTAGKEALGADRVVVRDALGRLGRELRLRNVWKSLEFLDRYWAGDGLKDGEEHDFIPY